MGAISDSDEDVDNINQEKDDPPTPPPTLPSPLVVGK